MKVTSRTMDALEEVLAERYRQYDKFGDDNPLTRGTDTVKFAILGEEVGEVAHGLCELQLDNVDEDTFEIDHRKELIQVAAVAVAMVEDLSERIDRAREDGYLKDA